MRCSTLCTLMPCQRYENEQSAKHSRSSVGHTIIVMCCMLCFSYEEAPAGLGSVSLGKAFQDGAPQLHDAPAGMLSGVLGFYRSCVSTKVTVGVVHAKSWTSTYSCAVSQ